MNQSQVQEVVKGWGVARKMAYQVFGRHWQMSNLLASLRIHNAFVEEVSDGVDNSQQYLGASAEDFVVFVLCFEHFVETDGRAKNLAGCLNLPLNQSNNNELRKSMVAVWDRLTVELPEQQTSQKEIGKYVADLLAKNIGHQLFDKPILKRKQEDDHAYLLVAPKLLQWIASVRLIQRFEAFLANHGEFCQQSKKTLGGVRGRCFEQVIWESLSNACNSENEAIYRVDDFLLEKQPRPAAPDFVWIQGQKGIVIECKSRIGVGADIEMSDFTTFLNCSLCLEETSKRQMAPNNAWRKQLFPEIPELEAVQEWVGVVITLDEFVSFLGFEQIAKHFNWLQGTGLKGIRLASVAELEHFAHQSSCLEYFERITQWWERIQFRNLRFGYPDFLEGITLELSPIGQRQQQELMDGIKERYFPKWKG
ncbi:MAG: hypothetical protein IPJ88_11895 [Myxococcales bacterium]|nr:MAG: hypothetical protein IPJ88_11895 [Myxococcales bacterium]